MKECGSKISKDTCTKYHQNVDQTKCDEFYYSECEDFTGDFIGIGSYTTFLPINFTSTPETNKTIKPENPEMDPIFWVLIALALIGGVLLLAILVTIEYRQRRQRALNRAAYDRTANATTIDTIPTTKSDYQK